MRLGDRGVMTARTDFAPAWEKPAADGPFGDASCPVGGPEGRGRNLRPNKMNTETISPGAPPGATWTTERIAQLQKCVTAGLTCSQIAAEIGVTRNAVIGKLHRLGLTTGGRPGRRPLGLTPRMPTAPRAARAPRGQSRLARLLREIGGAGRTGRT